MFVCSCKFDQVSAQSGVCLWEVSVSRGSTVMLNIQYVALGALHQQVKHHIADVDSVEAKLNGKKR